MIEWKVQESGEEVMQHGPFRLTAFEMFDCPAFELCVKSDSGEWLRVCISVAKQGTGTRETAKQAARETARGYHEMLGKLTT